MNKQKPILFNTPMVQAILDGRKTQTRRVIPFSLMQNADTCKSDSSYVYVEDKYGDNHHVTHYAPYKKGDILWVRETFCLGKYESVYIGEGCVEPTAIFQYESDNDVIYYADAINICDFSRLDKEDLPKWKPSIHMPKEYARIFLKVTDVRVKRLQDIRLKHIICEGFIPAYRTQGEDRDSGFEWWIDLWNSTSKDGYKWDDNPYVFVYEFERVEKPNA